MACALQQAGKPTPCLRVRAPGWGGCARARRHALHRSAAACRGSREYNLALGQKRADAVMNAMELLGAKPSQMEAISFGKEKPKAMGTTAADYAENRRVDIVYQR